MSDCRKCELNNACPGFGDCPKMTTTNLIELRKLAESANTSTEQRADMRGQQYRSAWDALNKFRNEFIPAKVIELLDALEAQAKQIEALQANAERFQYIKDNIRVGAVQTQLPLNRVHYWYGYETAADHGSLEEAIDAARKGNL